MLEEPLFSPRADLLLRLGLLGTTAAAGLVLWAVYGYTFSSYGTGVGEFVEQPVPFSHEHHVSGLGIDCRYCHTSAAQTARAGMPTSDTCMHCHAQIWTNAEMLAPLRESWRNGQPIAWQRVNKLPDYVFFNHSVHIRGGIGCSTCHGRVDQMPLMMQAQTLYMRWCVGCHRDPEPYVRRPDEIYKMDWRPDEALLRQDRKHYPKRPGEKRIAWRSDADVAAALTDCTACHR